MTAPARARQRRLPAVTVAVSVSVIFVVVLSIPLGLAAELGLTRGELSAWIAVLYGTPAVLSFGLAWRTRQPLLLTGNIFVLIFVASLGDSLAWAELVGASMAAGAIVLALGWFGWTDRLAAWLPPPIVYGVLAGAVVPFVIALFDALAERGVIVATTLAAYLLGRRFLEPRVPALLPALLAGLTAAAFTGGIGALPARVALPALTLTMPQFSPAALATATPVIVVLITLQATAPSVVFLRAEGYAPPERMLTVIGGGATMLASLFGPLGISLSLPATALSAGPDAGAHEHRYRAVLFICMFAVVIALLAGYAADLESLLAGALLTAVIGLAVLRVLTSALQQVVAGPLVLGPVFAFTIALSDLSLFGMGPFFWALVLGLVIARFVERDAWQATVIPDAEKPAAG